MFLGGGRGVAAGRTGAFGAGRGGSFAVRTGVFCSGLPQGLFFDVSGTTGVLLPQVSTASQAKVYWMSFDDIDCRRRTMEGKGFHCVQQLLWQCSNDAQGTIVPSLSRAAQQGIDSCTMHAKHDQLYEP